MPQKEPKEFKNFKKQPKVYTHISDQICNRNRQFILWCKQSLLYIMSNGSVFVRNSEFKWKWKWKDEPLRNSIRKVKLYRISK